MPESDAIEKSSRPATVESLTDDLVALGVRPGMVTIVHSSLSSMGWVNGGAAAVILALQQAITAKGTLVMPTHSAGLTDPAGWQNPPVPTDWWQEIRDTMPAFDPDHTPTRAMGAIPEAFRKNRGVLRSHHPHSSFAAWGHHAHQITSNHELSLGLGEGSPLARLYELDGSVLLIGVGHDRNTSMHLSEYRTDNPARVPTHEGAPIEIGGQRQWVTFDDIDVDNDDFEQIAAAFALEHGDAIRTGQIGMAASQLMRQRPLVDFAAEWMSLNRSPTEGGG